MVSIDSKLFYKQLVLYLRIFSSPKPSAVITEPAKLGACSEALFLPSFSGLSTSIAVDAIVTMMNVSCHEQLVRRMQQSLRCCLARARNEERASENGERFARCTFIRFTSTSYLIITFL